MFSKYMKSKEGAALPIVLMIFVVLSILGLAMLGITLSEAKQSTWQNNRVQAHYLARSGVQHGLKLFENEIGYPGSMLQLTTLLNSQVIDSGTGLPKLYSIAGAGTYDIIFEPGTYSGEIKIISNGKVNGKWGSTQVVTYTQSTSASFGFEDPSDAWLTGINLDKGISTSESYIDYAVEIESKNSTSSIQSPKGSSSPSVFQATIIKFTDFKGRSLRQVTNSVSVTFDAQLMFFLGDIILNGTNDPLILTTSDDVKASVSSIPLLQQLIDDYDPFGTDDTDGITEEGTGYDGIVKFGNPLSGSIKDYDENEILPSSIHTEKRYYYFKSGINLQNAVDLNTKLAPVLDPDLIDALDAFIGIVPDSTPPFWDSK